MSLRRALLVVTAFAVTTFFIFWLWQDAPASPPPVPGRVGTAPDDVPGLAVFAGEGNVP